MSGAIERTGLPETILWVKGLNKEDNVSRVIAAPDHMVAVAVLMDWIKKRLGSDTMTAVGHRVVHGGPKYSRLQRITAEMVEKLHRLSPFDPEHLPEETGSGGTLNDCADNKVIPTMDKSNATFNKLLMRK